ncbi:class I SAM-dependent methyltransferase [bacterium D16-50]|jgi:ubiquinone/menaquinone biosynthesis C-methylase UbiE|nr:methyltransferase domain-containing protein [Lachnospiraceae bacterium]RKJ21836.1 class I SAM-dependent methyltransferase [bacterium D16-50]
MIDIENMSNRDVIEEQYKNTDNLTLRKSLHDKYSVNKMGFQKWMFQQYPFRKKGRVLELGSGRGELWSYYFEDDTLQSYEMELTLSDFSEAMVDCIRNRFSGRNLSVKKIDILDIPFQEGTFDLIIANSMLYHVRDIDRGLSEVRRVLKRDGLFYCSTLGTNGMMQYLYHALDELGIPYSHGSHLSFTLQNGMELLKKQFGKVERRDYEDALEIDNVEDYISYIYSMASLQGLDEKYHDVLRNYFDARKVNGYLHVPKEYGMFVAGDA